MAIRENKVELVCFNLGRVTEKKKKLSSGFFVSTTT